MKKERPTMWTFADAREFYIKLLPNLAEVGYGIGLTGSVLYRGDSKKDLDVIVYPMNGEALSIDHARQVFRDFGMKLIFDEKFIKRMWKRKGSTDTKHVEAWEHEGRRVDVFFLK